MMSNEEHLCKIFDNELVNHASKSTKDLYTKSILDIDLKYAKSSESTLDYLYNEIHNKLIWSYLEGVQYGINTQLSSVYKTTTKISDFHKNLDFAVLFDFYDNDFANCIEAGAKFYCEKFNCALNYIDRYDDSEFMKKSYIEEFNKLTKIDLIKSTIKCGFLSHALLINDDVINSLETAQSELKYMPWDGKATLYKEVNGESVETGEIDRFIVGTREEITNVFNQIGRPYTDPNIDFPLWCNSEVLIMYMKNDCLTYIIR